MLISRGRQMNPMSRSSGRVPSHLSSASSSAGYNKEEDDILYDNSLYRGNPMGGSPLSAAATATGRLPSNTASSISSSTAMSSTMAGRRGKRRPASTPRPDRPLGHRPLSILFDVNVRWKRINTEQELEGLQKAAKEFNKGAADWISVPFGVRRLTTITGITAASAQSPSIVSTPTASSTTTTTTPTSGSSASTALTSSSSALESDAKSVNKDTKPDKAEKADKMEKLDKREKSEKGSNLPDPDGREMIWIHGSEECIKNLRPLHLYPSAAEVALGGKAGVDFMLNIPLPANPDEIRSWPVHHICLSMDNEAVNSVSEQTHTCMLVYVMDEKNGTYARVGISRHDFPDAQSDFFVFAGLYGLRQSGFEEMQASMMAPAPTNSIPPSQHPSAMMDTFGNRLSPHHFPPTSDPYNDNFYRSSAASDDMNDAAYGAPLPPPPASIPVKGRPAPIVHSIGGKSVSTPLSSTASSSVSPAHAASVTTVPVTAPPSSSSSTATIPTAVPSSIVAASPPASSSSSTTHL